MDTKATNRIPINSKLFHTYITERLRPYVQEYTSQFNGFLAEIKGLYGKNNIYIKNFDVFYKSKNNLVIPNFSNYRAFKLSTEDKFCKEEFLVNNYLIKSEAPSIINKVELISCRNSLLSNFSDDTYFVCEQEGNLYSYNPSSNVTLDLNESVRINNVYAFPIVRFEEEISSYMDLLFRILIRYSFLPEYLSEECENNLKDLSILFFADKEYFTVTNQELKFQTELMLNDSFDEKYQNIFDKLSWKVTQVRKEYVNNKNIGGVMLNSKDILLNCEKIRADIEPYEEKWLTDPNRGHWDLWLDDKEETYTAATKEEFMARNPRVDVNEDGVIAIDFGTKSTIVVYQKDIEHSLPMAIGDGNLSKGPTPQRYENPTIMQFVNLDKFLASYREKAGRPDTVWEDLPISHTAFDKLVHSSSVDYYAFLYQIKQWAGLREKQFRIKDLHGSSYILPSFLDIKEGDFNPIEIYAYYIGLYINNMRNGIYLDYYLSFPVTYEKNIRKKIVESFEKGLKKSLPIHILNDTEIMEKFHVNGDISEPAAYAVCALQEYGFEPEEGEEIFYGIFDFGGGTTDFDFGLWSKSKKRRYDYTIENFGAGGDEFLGGENLLEMLAFEVFKSNQKIMRESQFCFTLAPKCKEFLGSDALLSDSQEAEKNMHNLMEVLRPYWEKPEIEENLLEHQSIDDMSREYLIQYTKDLIDKYNSSTVESSYVKEYRSILDDLYRLNDEENMDAMINLADQLYEIEKKIKSENYNNENKNTSDNLDNNFVVVSLFNKEGELHANVQLSVTRQMINDFIKNKISEGVDNFFAALLLSYQNDKVKKPTTVNILLAGNSCKSPIVKKVFEEKIEEQTRNIKEKIGIQGDIGKLFEIFPPLGTKASYRKLKEREVSFKENDFEKPTGKTGVAFGLIQCREGGTIERISNIDMNSEIPFQFFIGNQSAKKFVLFKDDSKLTKFKGKPDYNEWYKFIEADLKTFYIYYTTQPECVNGNLPISEVKMKKCSISVVDENAFVYIRAITPHSLEYVVSASENIEKDKLCDSTVVELG